MQRRKFLQRILLAGSGLTIASSVGCGTVLHQERIHQPHSRDIDWKIAALDGLSLALFFVPGVVAFVVDFYTGAIYLPPECEQCYGASSELRAPCRHLPTNDEDATAANDNSPPTQWRRESLPSTELNQNGIEQVVSESLGRRVSLRQHGVRVSRLLAWQRVDQQIVDHGCNARLGVSFEEFLNRAELG